MEVVLAVRTALHSGGVFGWLFATIRFGPEDSHRCCAAILSSTTSDSPRRSTRNISSVATGRDKRGCSAWISRRTNRNWRRNLSHAGPAFLSVGPHSPSGCRLGAVHLGELDRRTNWLLHKSPHHPF